MTPCISQVTTLSSPFEVDIPAFARAGWPAVEIWLTKLEKFLESHSVAEARKILADEGIRAVCAASQGGLLTPIEHEREAHWSHFRRRLEILRELEVGTLVITPDFVTEPRGDAIARALQSLVDAASLAAEHQVRLALEIQSTSKFGASLDTALAFIQQSGAEDVGVCLDLFHYYTGPSKFEDCAYLSRENLAWVQLSDLSGIPRELAGDSDRILPGDGDFQLEPILDHLARIGYDGFASLEVLNPQFWQIPADRVAYAGYHATCRVLQRAQQAAAAPGGS
jgi:sugar phosphate isomerase/epimerase